MAFGQPSSSLILSVLAACIGYSLFWKAMLSFPKSKQRFWLAAAWFSCVQAVQLSWMTSIEYVGPFVLIVYLILSCAVGLEFACISSFLSKEKERLTLINLLALASVWSLLEWSRLFIMSGFSWNPVGLALTASVFSLQMASLVGIFGLSFWVIFTNLLGLKLLLRVRDKKKLAWWVLPALLPYLFGAWQIYYHHQNASSTPSLKFALVQTGLLPTQKTTSMQESILSPTRQWERILTGLKKVQLESLDLIVLPEGVVPYGTDDPLYTLELVKKTFQEIFQAEEIDFLPPMLSPVSTWARDQHGNVVQAVGNRFWGHALANYFNSNLILGLEDAERGAESTSIYQSAFYLVPHQIEKKRYEKRILAPMGEYIPFEWCKKLAARYGIYDSFIPGKDAKVFQGKHPLSISICYEETYPYLIREGRVLGASLFVNVTNDGWFSPSRLPEQHLYHSRVRAVENGVPLLRACNTGITSAIDSFGKICHQLDREEGYSINSAAVLFGSISTYHYPTLYTYFGDWLLVGISIFFIALALWKWLSILKTKKPFC